MPHQPVSPPFATITEQSIAALVDTFYVRVRQDEILGPVFEHAIAQSEWPDHLVTMRRFWSSVMLTSGAYSGNPVQVHRAVPGMERDLFAHWLKLFTTTAADLFAPDQAEAFALKAHRIATSLQLALFHRLDQPPQGLPRHTPAAA